MFCDVLVGPLAASNDFCTMTVNARRYDDPSTEPVNDWISQLSNTGSHHRRCKSQVQMPNPVHITQPTVQALKVHRNLHCLQAHIDYLYTIPLMPCFRPSISYSLLMKRRAAKRRTRWGRTYLDMT
jgi:hypothetical protein